MAHNDKNPHLSAMVDLSPEVYAQGADVELLCCQTHPNGVANWVSAAELVYEFTGNPGTVVRNTIHFNLGKTSTVDLNLVDGSFEIKEGETVVATGRKGLEFLMAYRSITLEDALEFVARKYSLETARVMAEDYVRMRLRNVQSRLAERAD